MQGYANCWEDGQKHLPRGGNQLILKANKEDYHFKMTTYERETQAQGVVSCIKMERATQFN